ncbi:Uncharacterized protein Fot_32060 [Forsythia ovata]|uniref:Uncharacterized protein n=1 Tax=Forsythia ovata TaxID=205694 RepID=A0ABD1T7A5_9LAMI
MSGVGGDEFSDFAIVCEGNGEFRENDKEEERVMSYTAFLSFHQEKEKEKKWRGINFTRKRTNFTWNNSCVKGEKQQLFLTVKILPAKLSVNHSVRDYAVGPYNRKTLSLVPETTMP